MIVPFVNLKKHNGSLGAEIKRAVGSVIGKSSLILGDELMDFEKRFAEYIGCKYAVGVGSGTGALHLALIALGIGKGDEVIVPANTYIADALAVEYCGASLKLVDVDEDYYIITPHDIHNSISEKTKAVIPVHLYGQGCNMDAIEKIKGISIIEDCAQSVGCRPNGEQTGSLNTGCFSFYPAKNLGAVGDGGMITTNSKKMHDKLTALRNYGSQKKYYHDVIGYNCRLDTLQAAILTVKLKHLDKWNEARRMAACAYAGLLNDCKEIILPKIWLDHVWHLFVVRVDNGVRASFMDYLKKQGISTLLHYPVPIHKQKCFSGRNFGKFPVTEKLAGEIVSLPMFPEITKAQIGYVCNKIKDFFAIKHKRR